MGAGQRIIAGLKEAIAVIRGEKEPARMTAFSRCDGCGGYTRTRITDGCCDKCGEPK